MSLYISVTVYMWMLFFIVQNLQMGPLKSRLWLFCSDWLLLCQAHISESVSFTVLTVILLPEKHRLAP